MLTTALRLLRCFLGVMLAAVAGLAALMAACIGISMTIIWWQKGYMTASDVALWRWSSAAVVPCALLTWAGARLADSGRLPGRERSLSLSLVRSESGRQQRWANRTGVVVWLIIFGGLLWTRVPGEPWPRAGLIGGLLVGGFLALHLRVLLHELGHLTTGSLFGLQPIAVQIGQGRFLWRHLTRAGFQWEWRLWPFAGCAQMLDRNERGHAWRQFVLVAGGPLADVLLVSVLFWSLRHLSRAHALPTYLFTTKEDPPIMGGFLFAFFGPMIFGLVPSWIVVNGRLLHSDGWWLAKVFFLPAEVLRDGQYDSERANVARLWIAGRHAQAREELGAVLARYPERAPALALLESWLHRNTHEPDRAADCYQRALDGNAQLAPGLRAQAWSEHAVALTAGGDPGEARAACAALLERVTAAEERVRVLAAFARIPILYHGMEVLLPDAERWCGEARALAPESKPLSCTWGSLLVEQGRNEEAVPILHEAIAFEGANEDRGIASFYLALAAGRLGRRREMLKYRSQTLRFCGVPALLGRVQAEIPAT